MSIYGGFGYVKVSFYLFFVQAQEAISSFGPVTRDQPLNSLSFPRARGFGTIDDLVDLFVGGVNLPDFP